MCIVVGIGKGRGVGSDIDAQEMMERAKIRHGELRLEGVDDGGENGGGVSRENDVIHID